MVTKEIFDLITQTCDALEQSGLIAEHIAITEDTVLMGTGMVLDSLAFVTLFMDLESRLQEKSGKEIYLLIDEISDDNIEALTVGGLVKYIEEKFQE